MNLTNGHLFWPTTTASFTVPKIKPKAHYDVIIIGAGMSGALCAYELTNQGYDVLSIDKRHIAEGSTSANTGLLQYSNDIMLVDLAEQIGEEDAVLFYRLCEQAMQDLTTLATSLSRNTDYIERPSIYYASTAEDVPRLQKNYTLLKKYGFEVAYLDRQALANEMPFEKEAALKTYGDAEVNPVKFVQALFSDAKHDIVEECEVTATYSEETQVRVETSKGTFHAKHVIHTTGYETPVVGKRIGAAIHRSYVVVTEPINEQLWQDEALIWETAHPYLYIRTTVDKRLIIGGLDEDIAVPPTDKAIQQHAEKLLKEARELFPSYDLKAAYAYGATFGESYDNLPFIGEHPTKKRQYYLLGYGGNGTVYSMMGAKMITSFIKGKEPVGAHIVRLSRTNGVR